MTEQSEEKENGHSRYVDLLSDPGFKRVMGTPGNEDLLMALLSVLLPEIGISKITYIDKEKMGKWREAKKTSFDVLCETDTGSKIMIEVQVKQQGWFSDRTVFYASQCILEQHKEGDNTYKLIPIISVSILDFNLEHTIENSSEKMLWNYSLWEDNCRELLSDCLHFTYLELPKFNKTEDELETFADKLYFCLRYMDKLTERPAQMNEDIFKRLFDAAEIASMTAEEYKKYIDWMTTERDHKNQIAYAKDQGRAEGEAKGRAEGRAEGISQVASRLKATGMPIPQITVITGLSANELAML